MIREFPQQPVAAVSTLVVMQNQVLLVQRGHEPGYGEWGLPGGVIELGETARQAAAREVLEECGIRIKVGNVIDHVDAIFFDADKKLKYHYVILVFLGEYLEGMLSNSPENLDARWVRLNRTGEYRLSNTADRLIGRCKLGPVDQMTEVK